MELSRAQVVEQLRALGVRRGDVLLVHTSFRAVRPIANGPAGLIHALQESIAPDGTLVMPSWTASDEDVFDPRTTPAAPDLGIVAETFRRRPDVRRSDHPFAFAAWGPYASMITRDSIALPPHGPKSPVGRVLELNGVVLLLGVGHDANTTIHLAEILGNVPYGVTKHCTVVQGGRKERVEYRENDHCCQRFAIVDEWLREGGLQTEGPVGHAQARLMRARDVVRVVREHLAADPLVFLHPPDAGCEECNEARLSVRYN
jgi:aminoglycoside 3-N-acetyltransferase